MPLHVCFRDQLKHCVPPCTCHCYHAKSNSEGY